MTFRKVECPERMVALVANDPCQRPLLPVVVPLNPGDICVQRNRVRHAWDLELVLGLASVVAKRGAKWASLRVQMASL